MVFKRLSWRVTLKIFRDMPEAWNFSSLDSCQKRFLWTHKEDDLAPHPVVGLVLQVGDSEKRSQAFETKYLRKLLSISHLEHKTNDWVRSRINFLAGPQEPLLATVKRRKLPWYRHVTGHNSLSKTILQGLFEGGLRRGRQRKCWMDIIKEWIPLPFPELLTMASCRKVWKRISAESSLMSPRRPNRSRD